MKQAIAVPLIGLTLDWGWNDQTSPSSTQRAEKPGQGPRTNLESGRLFIDVGTSPRFSIR